MKNLQGVKRADLWKIDPRLIKEESGFNIRDYDKPEVEEHIAGLTAAFLNGQYIPPIVIRENDSGEIVLIDGHCRHRAALRAIEQGADGLMLTATKFKGSDVERIEVMLQSGEGLKFTPLETATGYLRLNRMGMEIKDIAARVNKSVNHVGAYLTLATAPFAVQQMVQSGKVAANVAIEAVRKHGEKATDFLQKSLEKAEKQGKTKVTASVVRVWIPPRQTVAAMTDVVERITERLAAQPLSEVTDSSGNVSIPAELLNELLAVHQEVLSAKGTKGTKGAKAPTEKDEQQVLFDTEAG